MTRTARLAAQDAEKALNWAEAARQLQIAIDNYPTAGALADLDKAKMGARRDAALGMLVA